MAARLLYDVFEQAPPHNLAQEIRMGVNEFISPVMASRCFRAPMPQTVSRSRAVQTVTSGTLRPDKLPSRMFIATL